MGRDSTVFYGTKQVNVAIVDDQYVWRRGVKAMLEGTEFVVVGETSSGREAGDLVRRCSADIALLEVQLQEGGGTLALAGIKRCAPKAQVLILSYHDSPTLRALCVSGGASGYLLKGLSRTDLLSSMRRTTAGETTYSANDLMFSLRGVATGANASKDLYHPLTERELQVLELISTGMPNRDIGNILLISDGTVRSHVDHIMGKLNMSNRVRVAVWAVLHDRTVLQQGPSTRAVYGAAG